MGLPSQYLLMAGKIQILGDAKSLLGLTLCPISLEQIGLHGNELYAQQQLEAKKREQAREGDGIHVDL